MTVEQAPQAPPRASMEQLLAEYAPLAPAPLCGEIMAHQAHSLVAVWEAAERLAGCPLPAPFWAYAWPGGSALARVLLDSPSYVRGRRVLDFGGGGGVVSLAAAHAGAGNVTINDIDPWALLAASIAARAQSLSLATLHVDLCDDAAAVADFDVVLCSDLAYERRHAPRQRRTLERARRDGATVLIADAGRPYFDPAGLRQLAEYTIAVPQDLEGTTSRLARVYEMEP